MQALVFTGEELQADVRGSQLLGELQAAAQALVLVDDEGGRDAGGRTRVIALSSSGRVVSRAGEIFSGKIRVIG